MFDIGFGELFLIAVVALLVLGPERLPKAARFAGLWVRRARAQWYSVKAELENELADEELKRSLRQTQADLREARDALAQSGAALRREVEQAGADIEQAGADIQESLHHTDAIPDWDTQLESSNALEQEEEPPLLEDDADTASPAAGQEQQEERQHDARR